MKGEKTFNINSLILSIELPNLKLKFSNRQLGRDFGSVCDIRISGMDVCNKEERLKEMKETRFKGESVYA